MRYTSVATKIQSLLDVASSFSRLYEHTKDANIGAISACRAGFTKRKNNERSSELENMIRSAGFGFTKLRGRYVENYGQPNAHPVDESSYLVIGDNKDDSGNLRGHLLKWGKHFEQDSIMYKPWDSEDAVLIGTNDSPYPGLGKSHTLGKWHPNRTGEFYSLMRGRPFTFEPAAFAYVNPKSFFSRREALY